MAPMIDRHAKLLFFFVRNSRCLNLVYLMRLMNKTVHYDSTQVTTCTRHQAPVGSSYLSLLSLSIITIENTIAIRNWISCFFRHSCIAPAEKMVYGKSELVVVRRAHLCVLITNYKFRNSIQYYYDLNCLKLLFSNDECAARHHIRSSYTVCYALPRWICIKHIK